MSTSFPTDSELDRLAKAYMTEHRVSYAEALSAVVEQASSNAQPQVVYAEARAGQRTDAELDTSAKQYARAHKVSYAEALTAVAHDFHSRAQPQAYAQASTGQRTDAQIDTSAKQYARTHSVSYAEALTAVCQPSFDFGESSQAVSFSEAVAPSHVAQLMEQQKIEVFRAGTHRDDQGVEHYFSEADLDGMASSYNPALREAPLTVGHPKDNLPAYGWVKGVSRAASGELTIAPHKLEPQFAEMVQAGRFKKRSASFYPPQSPHNPTPGKWYLRHVAFLGAQQPAVAGLKDIPL